MIGILGLQGDYAAHGKMLDALAVESRVVKKPEQLSAVDGLIFPGGESTTLIKLMDSWEFWAPLRDFAAGRQPHFWHLRRNDPVGPRRLQPAAESPSA